MIIEIRIYQVKPGQRDRFVHFFEHKSGPVQRSKGIKLFGPFIDLEKGNTVVYLRGFETLGERSRIRALFYEGPEWRDHLKAEAREIIQRCDVMLAASASSAFSF